MVSATLNRRPVIPDTIDALVREFSGGSTGEGRELENHFIVLVPLFKRNNVNHAQIYTSQYADANKILPEATAYALPNKTVLQVMFDYLEFLEMSVADVKADKKMDGNKLAFVQLTFPFTRTGYIKGRAEMFVGRYCGTPLSESNAA